MRRLYLGDFQPALEAAFLAEMQGRRRADPLEPALVIVPSQLLKLHLRRLLADRDCPHLNLRFVTLVDLARELSEDRLRSEGLCGLSPAGFRALARDVAREADPASTFHEVRELTGFTAVLAATIRDVRDCFITADRLARAAANRKQRDFAALLLAYERRLSSARLADDAAQFQIALQSVPDHPLLATAGPLFVYGFYDFNSAQRRLLEAAIRRAGAVAFAPIGEGPAFAYAEPTLAFFEALGFERARAPDTAAGPQTALRGLRARLFSSKQAGAPLPCDGSVRILACPGEAQEAREVLCAVSELAAEMPLHEVGVVLRGKEGLSLFHETLESFHRAAELAPEQRPPVFCQGGRPLSESRSARSFVMFLRWVQGGFQGTDLFEWLQFSGHDPRAAALERLARRAGLPRSGDPSRWLVPLARLREEFERKPSSSPDHQAERLADLRALERCVLDLENLRERCRAAHSHAELNQHLSAAFRRLRKDPEEWLDLFAPLSQLDLLGLPADLETFIDAVETTLAQASESQGAFQQGLLLGSLLPVRGLPFRALVLPGLLDGRFPRKPSPDPILLDRERAELSRRLLKKGDVGLPLSGRAFDEDRLLFRLAVAAASDRLILTYPRLDAMSGNERIPSPLLFDAAESLAGRRLQLRELERLDVCEQVPIDLSDGDAGREPLELLEFDRVRLSRDLRSGSSTAVHCLMQVAPTTRSALESERARWQRLEFTPFDAVLSSEVARRLGQSAFAMSRRPISASRLQEYAGCPFRFFSQEVLGLREPDDADELEPISPAERGSLMHAVLEEFFRELIETNEPFPLRESRAEPLALRLEAVARGRFERFERDQPAAHPFLLEQERRRMLDDLRFVLEREIADGSDRRPALVEVRFGQAEGHPALELDLDGRRVLLSGTIDRVDLSADGGLATVIDYKTGEAFAWDGDLKGGRHIQLPVYALALERVIREASGTVVDRTEYDFVTRKGRGVRRGAPAEAVHAWSGDPEHGLMPVLGRIVAGIEGGRFLADPGDPDLCRYCEFKLACGLGAGLEERFERKSKHASEPPR